MSETGITRPGGPAFRTAREINLAEIEGERVDALTKGVPGHLSPVRIGDIGSMGWNIADEDLPLPLLVIKETALANNIAVMQRYCEANEVWLAPHGKTTMAPQLFKRQLDAGCWAITAATIEQLAVYRRFGVPRIMLANQIVGRVNLDYLCAELEADPDFEFMTFVDSVALVAILSDAARKRSLKRPLQVLLEVGYAGGRTGVRDSDSALQVWQAIQRASPSLQLVGVAAFEGLLPVQRYEAGSDAHSLGEIDPSMAKVRRYFDVCTDVIERLLNVGALKPKFILTAGGSAAFDLVVDWHRSRWSRDANLVLRSGCYITHDHLMYADVSPLRDAASSPHGQLSPALELWAYVQSIPEQNMALLTFGRRDAPYDYGLPVPLYYLPPGSRERVRLQNCRVTKLNDQHAYLELSSNTRLEVGGRVVCGISHPCTAFDKWRLIPVVDDDGTVIDAIRTFF